MATEQQLIDALMKADAAGDTQAAELFASEIRALRATPSQQAPQTVESPMQAAPVAVQVKGHSRGYLLPAYT